MQKVDLSLQKKKIAQGLWLLSLFQKNKQKNCLYLLELEGLNHLKLMICILLFVIWGISRKTISIKNRLNLQLKDLPNLMLQFMELLMDMGDLIMKARKKAQFMRHLIPLIFLNLDKNWLKSWRIKTLNTKRIMGLPLILHLHIFQQKNQSICPKAQIYQYDLIASF